MALWTPSNLSSGTLAGWYKADAITGKNDGDDIDSWVDSSGNSNTLTQTQAGADPSYQTDEINSLPIVRFDKDASPGDNLLNADLGGDFEPGTGDFFVAMVAKFPNSSGTQFVMAKADSGVQGLNMFISGGNLTFRPQTVGGTTQTIVQNSVTGDDFHVYVCRRSSSTLAGRFDGSTWSTDDGTKTNDGNVNNDSNFRLGSSSTGGLDADMDVGEALIGTGTLTDSDLQRMTGYLAWKWGLQDNLPSDHPYKTFPPTFTLPTVYWTGAGNLANVSDANNWSDSAAPTASKKCVFNSTSSTITGGTLTAGEVRFTDGFTGNLGTPAAPIQITTDLLSIGADNASINVNSNSIADIYIAGNGRGVFIEGTATTITVESLDDITLDLTSITTLEVRHDSGAGGMISTQAASNVNVGYGGNVIGQGDLGDVDIFQGGYLFQHAGSDVNSIELYGGECLFHGSDIVRPESVIYSGLLTTRSNQRHNVDMNAIKIYPNGTLDVSDSPLTEFSGAITSYGGTVILGDGYTVAMS
jgi:hypothetical protein